jgi:purine nucleoside permease
MKARCVLTALLGLVFGNVWAGPIPVKVMVVSTFEIGKDTGDKPGEFQYWADRKHLTTAIPVPGVDHPVVTNGQGLYGVVGGTTSSITPQMIALVLSGQFDFSQTYWVLNGIAGVDPNDASIGSAAWARWVVDGDLAHEIDGQEIPKGWPYGILPLGSNVPNQKPKSEDWLKTPSVYKLNPDLVKWAYQLSRNVELVDSPAMQALRAKYTENPRAQKPPHVLMGEALGSLRYWHGKVMTQWANDWVKLWTEGEGNFVMTAMEEQGFLQAMTRLGKMGKVNPQHVLVLRAGSNFCHQPPGVAVDKSMKGEYAGYIPALENAYRVGSPVVDALLKGEAP